MFSWRGKLVAALLRNHFPDAPPPLPPLMPLWPERIMGISMAPLPHKHKGVCLPFVPLFVCILSSTGSAARATLPVHAGENLEW